MKIRFAALARVSTEGQETNGHSLETQESLLKRQVVSLGGEIVKWYIGQEHSNTGAYRPIFEGLQKDLTANLWDALLVTAFDRLGRDSMEINLFMKMLRQNHKRLFVGGQEVPLNKPEGKLQANLLSSIAQFYVDQTAEKSLSSKINLVKQGFPACGQKPYGRTWSKDKGWGIDEEKQEFVKRVVKRYLDDGVPLYKIAAEEGWQGVKLWNLIRHKCGGDFEVKFLPDEFRWMRDMVKDAVKLGDTEAERRIKRQIEEKRVSYIIPVPPLLDAKTLARINERAEANKRGRKKGQKYRYLLSHFVFCARCSHAFHGETKVRKTGTTTAGYRHTLHIERQRTSYGAVISLEGERQRREKTLTKTRTRPTCDGDLTWIAAEDLEAGVLCEVVEMLTDRQATERALMLDSKQYHEAGVMKAELAETEKEIEAEGKKLERLIDAVADGTLTLAQVKAKKGAIDAALQVLNEKAEGLRTNLGTTKEEVSKTASAIINQIRASYLKPGYDLDLMTWEEKRAMLVEFFSVPGSGVFVDYVSKGKKKIKSFTIKGFLGQKKVKGKENLFCGDEIRVPYRLTGTL